MSSVLRAPRAAQTQLLFGGREAGTLCHPCPGRPSPVGPAQPPSCLPPPRWRPLLIRCLYLFVCSFVSLVPSVTAEMTSSPLISCILNPVR